MFDLIILFGAFSPNSLQYFLGFYYESPDLVTSSPISETGLPAPTDQSINQSNAFLNSSV